MATKNTPTSTGIVPPHPAQVTVSRTTGKPIDGETAPFKALTEPQRQALNKMAAGRSIKAVARDVGVHRNTIYNWLNDDPNFRAAYNAWRLELEESARARIAGLADSAIDALRRGLARGDGRIALAVLKGLNFLSPSPIGPRDPAEIRRRADIAEIDRETALRESESEIGHRRYLIDRSHTERYNCALREREAAREAKGQIKSPDAPTE